jgi:hypothetical protein
VPYPILAACDLKMTAASSISLMEMSFSVDIVVIATVVKFRHIAIAISLVV